MKLCSGGRGEERWIRVQDFEDAEPASCVLGEAGEVNNKRHRRERNLIHFLMNTKP
jgi:hypothetical protein